MPDKIIVSGTEAINMVAGFAHEVLGKGAGFIPETSDYDEHSNLWIIQGEIRYMGDYAYLLSHFLEVMNKPSQEFIEVFNNFNLTKKVIESLKDFKFRFYVSPDGKKLLVIIHEALFLILPPKLKNMHRYMIGEEDADAKYICKKAKELLSTGTTFRYLDFLPTIAIYNRDRWMVLAIVSYYSGFDVIPKVYYFEYLRDGTFVSFKGF